MEVNIYIYRHFQAYLTSKVIEHRLTTPYFPQQNGVIERLNRPLMVSARAMLSHSNLSNKLSAETVATATYTSGIVLSHLLTKSNLHPLRSGMATNPTLVITRYLGMWPTIMFPAKKGEKLRRHKNVFYWLQ